MITQTECSITYVRPTSHQIVFIFMGMREELSIHALDFVRATAIGERNIVFLKDPYEKQCFHHGISDEYDSLDGIVRWQQELLAGQFSHVREVFCAGTSAGGSAAIHTACRLRARAAISFGGRIGRSNKAEEREQFTKGFYLKVLGRDLQRILTPDEHAKLVEAFNDPEVLRRRAEYRDPAKVVDHERVAALVNLLKTQARGTDFHFYYAITNAIDRQFAEAFRECPNACLHPVTPPSNAWSEDVSFTDPDHGVVKMLHEVGQLETVFAAYF
jgi:hypothetical protein